MERDGAVKSARGDEHSSGGVEPDKRIYSKRKGDRRRQETLLTARGEFKTS